MWLTPSKFHFNRTFISEEIITSEGKACVIQIGDEFEYTESGVYTPSGITYFQKRFMFFKDNQLFILKENREILHVFESPHKFPLRHTHVCKDDIYTLTIEKEEHGCLRTLYSVKGPFKDYQIKTLYSIKAL